jgi:ribonuclease HI
MALQEVLEELKKKHPAVTIVAYMDDINLAGDNEACVLAFSDLVRLLADIGLVVNSEKCQALIAEEEGMQAWHGKLTKVIPRSNSSGLIVLGSPIGGSEFCRNYVSKSVGETIEECVRLVDTDLNLQGQCVWALILGSLIHRPAYLLRTCSPEITEDIIGNLDEALVRMALSLAHSDENVPSSVKTQITLSRKLGGLGVGGLRRTANSCYLASILDCAKVGGVEALALPDDCPQCPLWLAPYHSALVEVLGQVDAGWHKLWNYSGPLQKLLTNKITIKVLSDLTSSMHPCSADARRLALLRAKGASLWITAPPKKNETLNHHEYGSSLRLRLGLPLTSTSNFEGRRIFCPCTDELVTPTLEHSLACGCGKMRDLRKDRHDAIRDLIFRWLRSHNLQAEREIPLRKLQGEPKAKVMDVVLILANQLTWIDVTIVNGNTEGRRASGEKYPADAAAAAKNKKYADNVANQHAVLLPAGLEALGGFSKSSLDIIDQLASTVFPRTSRFVLAKKKQELMTSIAVELVKGNHRMVEHFSWSFRSFCREVVVSRGPGQQTQTNEVVGTQTDPNAAAAVQLQVRPDETSESQSSLLEPAPSALGELVHQIASGVAHETNFTGLLIQSDGAAKENPYGPAGAGAVSFESTNGVKTQLESATYFIGDPKSNIVAEYEGILLGLKLAFNDLVNASDVAARAGGPARKVRFESDCQAVVDQLNGRARCTKKDLKPLFARARDELFHLKNLHNVEEVELRFIPRRFNPVADNLAKAGMDNPVGSGFSSLDRPSFATISVYEVNKFMDVDGGKVLVQWKGFPEPEDFTWELDSELKTDLGRVTFHDMMQELLMSSAMNDNLFEQETAQQNTAIAATEHVAPDADASSACARPVPEAGPDKDTTPQTLDPCVIRRLSPEAPSDSNFAVALGRRRSSRMRTRPSRFSLARSPSAP